MGNKILVNSLNFRMKMIKLVLGITLFLSCFKCFAQQKTANQYSKFDSLPITIDLILEDAATNHYVLDWEDSLGIYQNNQLVDKPYELHCYVSDGSGLIGSYHGLSTSFSFCNLHTKDSLIDVVFILAPDFNSKKARDFKSTNDTAWFNTYVEYERMKIPVKRIENLRLNLIKRDIESDVVVVKNNCAKNHFVVVSYWNKKSETRLLKKGQLLMFKMKTGDGFMLKNGSLNYTHIAKEKVSIYLCSISINR
ncbi:MAG: hypothetical protein JNJ40_18450 [Bacteroidia bacterium]|nr:hypothetical protein [Bacteroidia bacterium]